MTLNGIPGGTLAAGAAPEPVEVTLCNDSPVDYPAVGVVLVLSHCSCATNPMQIPQGTVERYDDATSAWVAVDHPAVGGGMDYLGTFAGVQELPKGKSVTMRYRVALDASMTAGKGGVEAAAVVPDPVTQIGSADLPFTVPG